MGVTLENYFKSHLPKISMHSVQAVVELHKQGGTVPFIARYRKEKTGNLDEVQIRDVLEMNDNFSELITRQAFIVKELEAQGNLTDDLKKRLTTTMDIDELEELYRPYKKKKKTKAKMARDAGIEPYAQWIWDLGKGTVSDGMSLEVKAKTFQNVEHQFATYQEVMKGAEAILIEKITNDQDLRAFVRDNLLTKGRVVSKKGKKFKANSKYDMYAEFEEGIQKLLQPKVSYRYMAMRRGWNESELTLNIEGEQDMILKKFVDYSVTTNNQARPFLEEMAKNALDLHVMPSIGNEIHKKLKDTADLHATDVFAENVRKILLASPFGPKCVLGVDPGLKSGAKVALVDHTGKHISHTVMDILGGNAETNAEKLFKELLSHVKVEAIAVGNGTAGRETEIFIRKILKKLEKDVPIIMVNESGASVYSASETAREEFPELDLTIRGAISIARRLQDPLSELVKIDPKSIGVGQYQHDITPTRLEKSLTGVVESCVNTVGVDLNTASSYLLQFISGIGPATAKNIVDYRGKNGLFKDRADLLKVPQFSTKAFEQSAGFLRVNNGINVLDQTGIHPERYTALREMAQELNLTVSGLIGDGAKKLLDLRTKWAELVGEFTFNDMIKELEKPGRDPRNIFKVFSYRDDIFEVKDLKEQMICPGLVTNVTNFGAFVDIGVHQDGLVHISELTHDFVDDPRKVVSPGDQVEVKVLKIDLEKKQIYLTMKLTERPQRAPQARPQQDGAARRPQGDRPQGDRPQRAPRNDQRGDRPQGDRPRQAFNNDKRGPPPKGRGGPQQGQRPQFDRPKPPPKPTFNNPFAALTDLKIKK